MSDTSLRIDLQAPSHFLVSGEVDSYSSPRLSDALRGVPIHSTIVIDMAGVDFIDSSGLRVLVETWNRQNEADRELEIRNPSRVVHRLIEISGLDDRFHVTFDPVTPSPTDTR